MKNLFALSLCLFFSVSMVLAQTENAPISIGISGGKMAYNGDKGNAFFDFDQPFQGHVGLRLSAFLSDKVDVALAGSSGRHGIYNSSNFAENFLSDVIQGNVALHYKFLGTKKLSPFISGGLGLASYSAVDARGNDDTNFQVPLGLGAKVNISDNFGIFWHSQYGLNFGDDYDGVSADDNDHFLLHELGLNFNFGKKADADGDGIADGKDMCPDVPGVKQFAGCPDSDEDGIQDKMDDCPLVAGTAAYNGCPDTDGDGIIDSKDNCPNTAGTVDGCPDRDEDGIADGDDDCPDVFGTLKGCPDTDKDGVADMKDDCPEVYGTIKGCPDSDNDGIADAQDKCPDVKGVAPDGCPNDTDGDGVANDKDACPDVAGTVMGCPDGDKDGIADKDDKCPTVRGVAPDGCPKAVPAKAEKVFNRALRGIQFETSSSTFKTETYAILNEVVSVMKEYPNLNVSVQGHTDSQGADAMNQSLSTKRAEAVVKWLMKNGISPSRLTSAGFGETRPVGDNSTAEGRRMNRRVEFVVKN